MRASVLAACVVACLFMGVARAEEPVKPADPAKGDDKAANDKNSLAIGLWLGGNLKSTTDGLNLDEVCKGVREAFSDKQSMTTAEVQATIRNFQQANQSKMEEKMKKRGETAKAEGVAFLDKNKKETGIVTTASGLQYKINAEGAGDNPKIGDNVVVKYTGMLSDLKTVFDSTDLHGGEPAQFQLRPGGLIPGWIEGIPLMKPGAKFRFFIPAELAYGEHPPGAEIPPNAVLVFDVELIKATPAGAGGGK